jgi:hypothetical protein
MNKTKQQPQLLNADKGEGNPEFNDLLRRMLSTPPKPRAKPVKAASKKKTGK